MFLMICWVVGINEDVVQVNDHANIQEITEDVIHEMLESCESIGKSEGHNEPFKRTIAGAESGFPFITVPNTDKVIGMSEINGGVDMGFTHSGKEVRNEQKGISILLVILLRPWKSMQRQRVLSFLRVKITGAPWEEEVWQINLVQRWSSRKLWRTLSSDCERGYIRTIGREVPSFKLILRS